MHLQESASCFSGSVPSFSGDTAGAMTKHVTPKGIVFFPDRLELKEYGCRIPDAAFLRTS
jgi:hypothetical protein